MHQEWKQKFGVRGGRDRRMKWRPRFSRIPRTNSGIIFNTLVRNEVAPTATYSTMATNQCIVNEGTEDELICHAYQETKCRRVLYILLTVSTLGLILLLFYWKPTWKVRVRAVASDIDNATHVIIEDKYEAQHVKPIKQLSLGATSPFSSVETVLELKETSANDKSKVTKNKTALTVFDFEATDDRPRRFFEHKFLKYFWVNETFIPLRGLDYGYSVEELKSLSSGLCEPDRQSRRQLFGVNSITVEITPLFIILIREIFNPFYVFQLFSIVIWCIEEYFLFAGIILLLSAISLSVSLYMTRQQNKMINKMSSGSGTVQVRSGDQTESRDSSTLLPGDVIELQDGRSSAWCDMLLLSGSCVVSESMLTGESTPVLKTPLVGDNSDSSDNVYDPSRHKQHTIYSGTKVLDVQRSHTNALPKALVLRTGFYTEKGRMIESMLSPTPMDYQFYKDSLRFILIMVIFGLLGGVIAITVLSLQGASASHVITRVLDLITIVVPPGLPAALTIATIFAHRRLRLAKIFCTSPPRINISGKLNCMCFDKTGTLTENDLRLWGVLPCKDRQLSGAQTIISEEEIELGFYDAIHEYSTLSELGEVGTTFLCGMACCHSLVDIEGEVLGDPIDVELFRATGWAIRRTSGRSKDVSSTITPPSGSELKEISVMRVYQFNSVLRRMSVIASRSGSERKTVYVKGAPETIVQLCLQSTVPKEFPAQLHGFTQQGYRVLALATKSIDATADDIAHMDRAVVESGLQFCGLIVLSSPLRPTTGETILTLHSARIRTVMSTGDNLQTAISVARRCHMVTDSDKVVIVEAQPLDDTNGIRVTYSREGPLKDDRHKFHPPTFSKDISVDDKFPMRYSLALTGDTFSLLRKHAPKVLNRVLASGTVFARMEPDQKRQLVEELQRIDYIVGMCGDGANDCRALKSAHAGIALADAETSIVAPFTSMEKNISCCIKLIREGRGALVTSFGMIKYLCIYSFVQYLALIILYTINSYMSDIQFLFADIGVTGAVTLFFALAGAAKTLAKKPPHLSLVSPVMVTCLLSQILLLITFQVAAYGTLKRQSWHTPLVPNMTHPKENIVCEENTVMFYTACFQYLTLAFVFYKGLPYRLPLYRNYVYFVALVLLSIWVIVMLFAAVPPIDSWFSLRPLDLGFKFILLAYYIVHLACAIFIEKVLLESTTFRRILTKILGNCSCKPPEIDGRPMHMKPEYEQLSDEMLHDDGWPPINSSEIVKS